MDRRAGAANDGSQIDGAHDSDEEWSSTAGDTKTFTHEAMTACDITGPTGASFGSFTVTVDGGAPTTVSQSGATAEHVTLWSSGALSEGTHTIVVTVLSGTVAIDTFRPTFNPQRI